MAAMSAADEAYAQYKHALLDPEVSWWKLLSLKSRAARLWDKEWDENSRTTR